MATKSFTDAIFQGIKLYIEGVGVPFNAISITSGVGGLPSANISVPVQAGLMDIARFYQPKVHVFFEDRIRDYDEGDPAKDKLLFSGLISGVSYMKSKGLSAGTAINFSCVHKYFPIKECLIDYSGWLNNDKNSPNAGNAVKSDTPNSKAAVIEALKGVKGVSTTEAGNKETVVGEGNPEGRIDLIPDFLAEVKDRLMGMPGILVNYWNQLKRSSYNKSLSFNGNYENEAFVKMYEKLFESGLKFFHRVGGHYPIEFAIENTRQESCPKDPNNSKPILIPPCSQNFMKSSAQAEMAISNINSMLQNSGEVTTIYQIFDNFYNSVDYELITLASPAEAPLPPSMEDLTAGESTGNANDNADAAQSVDNASTMLGVAVPTYAIDTIVKPKLPFYFSPTCNVLFPGMYQSINVQYDEMNIPTRVDAMNNESIGRNVPWFTHFRAPHSIRKAISQKIAGFDSTVTPNLMASTASSAGAIGLYEQGRGVKMEQMAFPRWLAMYSHSATGANGGSTDKAPDKDDDPTAYAGLEKLRKGWEKRYPGEEAMNPYSKEAAGINSHHRILFGAADYYYTQVFARSKAGTVECPFNPFIVPGYPMDILEKNPLYPSFHAQCQQVTHTLTAESCSTTVQFVAAMTYSEMANYYIPFVHPFLQATLNLADNPSLLFPSGDTYKTADAFYRYTLGVPSIAPTDLMDLNTGAIYPHQWSAANDWTRGSTDSIRGPNGGEMNPNLTYEGNLSLVYRPIEDKAKIVERWNNQSDAEFIDMVPGNYTSTVIKYTDAAINESDKFEIGRSQFLDYDTYFGEPRDRITRVGEVNENSLPKNISAGNQTKDSNGNVVQDDTSFI